MDEKVVDISPAWREGAQVDDAKYLAMDDANDLGALRKFFEGFIIADPTLSYNKFDVFDYVGDDKLGSFQWTWETKHAGDFLGVAAAGKITKTRGVTVMAWRDGKICLERSIWDAIPVLQQLGAIPA